jgi:membrane-associated phospholipid phosphatase
MQEIKRGGRTNWAKGPRQRLRKHRTISLLFAKGLLAVLLGTGLLAGCGTLPNGHGWGQDATLFPGWQRFGKAARDAAFSPETWAPAAAALVLQIDDWDKEISEWAVDNTPIFGSPEDAEDASDYLRDATGVTYFLTALATPSGEDPKSWSVAKLKGLTVGVTAVLLTDGTTELLKEATDRTRPDRSDDESLPSGHTSSASAFATLANCNLQSLPLSNTNRTLLRIGFTSLAAATGWARVEAGRHFPSDVLAGYALGHFISAFFNDAFLGLDQNDGPQISIEPSKDRIILGIRFAY